MRKVEQDFKWQNAAYKLERLRVLQFEYLEPKEEIDKLNWSVEFMYSISDDFTTLSLDVVAQINFKSNPDATPFGLLRLLSEYTITGAEEMWKNNKEELNEFIAHCGDMNWLNVIRTMTDNLEGTFLEGHVQAPLLMAGSFMPEGLGHVEQSTVPKFRT
jgi:hypothetical protein